MVQVFILTFLFLSIFETVNSQTQETVTQPEFIPPSQPSRVEEIVSKAKELISQRIQKNFNCSSVSNETCTLSDVILGAPDTNYRFKTGQETSKVTRVKFIDSRIAVLTNDLCQSFPQLQNAQVVNVGLASIKSEALDGCQELIILNLSQNKLTSLDENLFSKLRTLTTLNLSNNQLKWFSTSYMVTARQTLQSLDLSSNQLMVFIIDPTFNMPALKSLKITNNLLMDIDAEVMKTNFQGLKQVFLAENRFICGRAQVIEIVLKSYELGVFKGSQCISFELEENQSVPASVFYATKNLCIAILIFLIIIMFAVAFLAFDVLK